MHLHIITIIFIIFEQINKIFTQGLPISPCPDIFQYRFDGFEWFGILSVRNPEFGRPIHLRVTLSMRGKPTTNYLGEIELLTRGQYLSEAPVLYKIKFPKSSFPPKLLQITTNNRVVCLGAADHGIFMTQIQLEHTRKFTFIPDNAEPLSPATSSSLFPSLSANAAAMSFEGVHPSSIPSIGMKEYAMVPAGTKYLHPANTEKNPIRFREDICGTIDNRIRYQVLRKLRQTQSVGDSSFSTPFKQQTDNIDYLVLSTLLPHRSDKISTGGKPASYSDETQENGTVNGNIDADNKNDDDDDEDDDVEVVDHNQSLPYIVTTDAEYDDEDLDESSMNINDIPSITRGAWPWLAAVYVNNITSLVYKCGGTLISSRIVISAAHCFQLFEHHYTPNEVLVFLGRHNLRNWNEEDSLAAPVDDIFIHPDYNQHLNSYDADIAVLILKYEVRFNTFIRPACMWSGSTKQQYIEGEHGVVVGWGIGGFNTTKDITTTSPVPRIVSTPIVSNAVCLKANPNFRSISSHRTFCAGSMQQEPSTMKTKDFNGAQSTAKRKLAYGPCSGDSGAGLMIFKNHRWLLRGTVSGSLPLEPTAKSRYVRKCSTNQYAVYTDVAKFLDWIYAFLI